MPAESSRAAAQNWSLLIQDGEAYIVDLGYPGSPPIADIFAGDTDELKAIGQLMAAAPQLLAACEEAVADDRSGEYVSLKTRQLLESAILAARGDT